MSEVYSELVNLREKRDQRAIDDLNKFFIFINSSYSLPLPENMETSGRQQAHVRSTTVNETAFLQLIEDLPKLFPNESPHTIKQLHLMLILMRRVGLRPFEVVKLKLSDLNTVNLLTITVRANEYYSVKSYSGYRKIPLSALLKENERNLMLAYCSNRKQETQNSLNRLLFSSDHRFDRLFNINAISKVVSSALSAYMACSCPMYQLRHSLISYLTIVLFGSDKSLTRLTPYSHEHASRIKDVLLNGNTQDDFYQLSALAGHLSPNTTLSTYCHFTDLLIHEAGYVEVSKYDINFWANLTNVRPSTADRWKKMVTNDQSDKTEISDCFMKGMLDHHLKYIQKVGSREKEVTSVNKLFEINNQNHLLSECDQILRKFDRGVEISVIATSLAQNFSWAESVVLAAKEIKEHNKYWTKRGQSRLYPTGSKKLTPPMVNSAIEMTDCFTISKRLSTLPEDKAAEIRWAANYLFENKQHGHNYVNFRSTDELERYLIALSPIVGMARWLIELVPLEGMLPVLSRWIESEGVNGFISAKTVRDRFKFPDGQVKLYFLKLDGVKITKGGIPPDSSQSSNALQYVLHLYAINKKAKIIEERCNSASQAF